MSGTDIMFLIVILAVLSTFIIMSHEPRRRRDD